MAPERSVQFEASPQTAESSPGWRGTERSWKESNPSRASAVYQDIRAKGQHPPAPVATPEMR